MILTSLVIGASLWVIAFVVILLRSFKRATYGMALTPICLNLSWDFVFAFVYEPNLLRHVSNPFYDATKMDMVTRGFCAAWAVADLIMLFQISRYGRTDTLRHLKPGSYYTYVGGLLLFMSCLICMSRDLFRTPSAHCLMWGMCITVFLSASYLLMALSRTNLRGQSIAVAILRLVGIELVCFALLSVLTPMLMFLFMAMFLVIDGMYIILLVRWCREEGVLMHPLKFQQ